MNIIFGFPFIFLHIQLLIFFNIGNFPKFLTNIEIIFSLTIFLSFTKQANQGDLVAATWKQLAVLAEQTC